MLPVVGTISCSRGTEAPAGWERVVVDNLSVLIGSGWQHRPVHEGVAVFTDLWQEQEGPRHILIAGSPGVSAADDALAEALDALRASWPGLRATSQAGRMQQDGRDLAFVDIATASPDLVSGRLWSVSADGACAVVVLGASRLDEAKRTVVEESLRLVVIPDAPTLPTDWIRVGRDATTFGVPRAWSVTGAVHGSERWKASWADADLDGFARARVVLCPDTGESSALDALAQIEADSIAGALPGFERAGAATWVDVGVETVKALRLPFTYGGSGATTTAAPTVTAPPAATDAPTEEGAPVANETPAATPAMAPPTGHGVMWMLESRRSETSEAQVSAVQVAFIQEMDEALATTLERSLWVLPPE